MFSVHVDTVYELRLALLPLATISNKADIKCTVERLSIIVVPTAFPFVASLRMLPPFFTSFQFIPCSDYFEEYHSGFLLNLFATNISNLYSENLSMTIHLGHHFALAPLKFEDPYTGYLQYSALVLSRPLNIDISPIDLGVFVAIPSAEFINLVADLLVCPNEIVSVSVTNKQAKFIALTKEVVFTTENKDCVIGGIGEGTTYYFVLTLSPMHFFYHIVYTTEFVWLFKTVSSRNLLSCCLGLHASYLVCF